MRVTVSPTFTLVIVAVLVVIAYGEDAPITTTDITTTTTTSTTTTTTTSTTAATNAASAADIQGRGHSKNVMKMNPYMLIPQLIALGFAPIVLANLKMMVMSALMINNMALNAAIFMTIRNMVFGPRPKVKYVNYGYREQHHHGKGDHHRNRQAEHEQHRQDQRQQQSWDETQSTVRRKKTVS